MFFFPTLCVRLRDRYNHARKQKKLIKHGSIRYDGAKWLPLVPECADKKRDSRTDVGNLKKALTEFCSH